MEGGGGRGRKHMLAGTVKLDIKAYLAEYETLRRQRATSTDPALDTAAQSSAAGGNLSTPPVAPTPPAAATWRETVEPKQYVTSCNDM